MGLSPFGGRPRRGRIDIDFLAAIEIPYFAAIYIFPFYIAINKKRQFDVRNDANPRRPESIS
jgi:hypothetical protein